MSMGAGPVWEKGINSVANPVGRVRGVQIPPPSPLQTGRLFGTKREWDHCLLLGLKSYIDTHRIVYHFWTGWFFNGTHSGKLRHGWTAIFLWKWGGWPIIWMVYHEAENTKKYYTTPKLMLYNRPKLCILGHVNLTAPQSFKISLRKNGHTF